MSDDNSGTATAAPAPPAASVDDAASRARAIAAALAPAPAAGGKRKAEGDDGADAGADADADADADAADARAGSRRKLDDGSAVPGAAAGDEAAALEAKRAALLREAGAGAGGDAAAAAPAPAPAAPAAAPAEPVVLVFTVPSAVAGTVIGRQGENIQAVQAKTGARISIQSQAEAGSAPERAVTVTGSAADVAAAKAMILHMVDERARMPVGTGAIGVPLMLGGGGGGGGEARATCSCPDEKVGAVIGRQGGNIKTIQGKTGTHVSVPKEQDPANRGTRLIVVTGPSQAAVDAAMAEIQSLIAGGGDPLPAGMPPMPAFGGGGMPYGGGVTVAGPGGTVSFSTQLTEDRAGALIGRGGATIRDLQDRSGARISCPTGTDPATGMRNVLISGPAHAVEMAKAEVAAIAAGASGGAGGRGGAPAGGAPFGGGGGYGGGAGGYGGYYGGHQQQPAPQAWGAPAYGGGDYGGAPAGGGYGGAPGAGAAMYGAAQGGAPAGTMSPEMQAQWAAYYAQMGQYGQGK
jgi:transcription antitermination factor NusA-like protein